MADGVRIRMFQQLHGQGRPGRIAYAKDLETLTAAAPGEWREVEMDLDKARRETGWAHAVEEAVRVHGYAIHLMPEDLAFLNQAPTDWMPTPDRLDLQKTIRRLEMETGLVETQMRPVKVSGDDPVQYMHWRITKRGREFLKRGQA